jgi:hypothetical protein
VRAAEECFTFSKVLFPVKTIAHLRLLACELLKSQKRLQMELLP